MSSPSGNEATRLTLGDLDIEIRPGREADAPLLLRLIRGMAEFEKLEVSATEQSG